jgi:tRNA threonylcarbamoyl adenosine modification protein (Sua5/YciO/YrdC/YwlC family)|tara:strand:+ start:20526 stop:21482 length:957 start_codon:yes stop_codon:yes gene_type:complete
MATMARVRARVDARARVGARGGERAVRGRARTRRWEKRGGGGERTRARTTTTRAKRGRGGGGGGGGGQATLVAEAMYVELDLDVVGLEGEAWKLDQAAEAIRAGEVGIIPTDTKYAFVADLTNQNAVQKLYDIKNAGLNKPLSILCRGFQDIDAYTTGFPSNPKPGMPLPFKLAKQCLPGPYTLILPASKELPKVCLMDKSTKDKARQCKSRKTVGVRIPDCDVTRALLDLLDAPLMCSTVPECDEDPAVIYDTYLPRGLGFLIDIGQRHANAASTVVDLSDGDARVLRAGAGEPDLWASMDEDDSVDNDPDAAWGFA